MKKIISLILVLMVGTLILVGCSNSKDEVNENLKNIQILVYDKSETLIYDRKIETEETTLLKALEKIDDLKVKTEDSQYGAFITSLKDIKQEDNYYWNYYVNGDYATVGISSYNIKENDKLEFRLEKFE